METERIPLEHPGVILKEEFMEPNALSGDKLAKRIGVPRIAISEIIRGQRKISMAVGLKLDHYFGLSKGYFSRLENPYQMEKTLDSEEFQKELAAIAS